MNLTRIQYFVEVAKLENFSKAAQALYVSQPNLSKQIALMEQELGFALFRRSGKNIQLTRAGQYLYERWKDLPADISRAIGHAEALSRGDEGSLSIGVAEGQDVNFFLASRIASLRERCPGVTIEMERNNFRNLRFFLCSAGKNNTALGGFFCFHHLDDNSVSQRFDVHISFPPRISD